MHTTVRRVCTPGTGSLRIRRTKISYEKQLVGKSEISLENDFVVFVAVVVVVVVTWCALCISHVLRCIAFGQMCRYNE